MSSPVLQKSLTVTGVDDFNHISCVTQDQLWVSDWNTLNLIDTSTGDTTQSLEDVLGSVKGKHTVNSNRELIYIDKNYNISKLSDDMKTTTILIDNPDPSWRSMCLHCSPSSGDLLVGMHLYDTHTYKHIGKVMRYSRNGKNTQTIPYSNTQNRLFSYPRYITENNNGDVVVSDSTVRAVVVVSGEGIHRFSYTGPPLSRYRLQPRGICTDALSHILVCDFRTGTIHMLSQDGQFLKYLMTDRSPWTVYFPRSLSYDLYTHCLWVGSGLKRAAGQLSVYRHINRHPAFLGKSDFSDTYLY